MTALLVCTGCVRVYRPVDPTPERAAHVTVTPDQVTLQWLGARDVQVEASMEAGSRTSLRAAYLASVHDPPCAKGVLFADVYRDGVLQLDGPVDLSGVHRVRFVYNGIDSIRGPLRDASAIDLAIESSEGTGCDRIALAGAPDRPWSLSPTSPGFLVGVGVRAFPVSTTSTVGLEPAWTAFFREGLSLGAYRAWIEASGGEDPTSRFGLAMMSLGGDRVLWRNTRWLVSAGVAYDVAVTGALVEHAPTRYGLHGPRVTPAVSFAPLNLSPVAGFPDDHRTLYIELEIPLSGWFAVRVDDSAPEPPAFLLVPAVGLHVNYAM